MKSAERQYGKPVKLPVLLLMLALLASCTSIPIIGEWKEIGGTEIIELFKDGSILLNSKYLRLNGSYKFVEKDKISVEFNTSSTALKGPFAVQVSVTDNKLTWIMPDGKIYKYERVKEAAPAKE